jgi:hypothetical protein
MLFQALTAVVALAAAAYAGGGEIQLAADAASVAACERLGEVKGSSAWGGMVTNMAYNRALAQLKSRAGKLGGSHVVLLNVSSGFAGSNMLGVVYRCPAAPAPVAGG